MNSKKKYKIQSKLFKSQKFLEVRLSSLTKKPLFWILTIFGNGLMLIAAVFFYFLEKDANPHLKEFIDALWWAVASVTTVGSGDVVPVTRIGKVLGILLMIFGSALISSFTALFATVLLEPGVLEVEEEIKHLEKMVTPETRKKL